MKLEHLAEFNAAWQKATADKAIARGIPEAIARAKYPVGIYYPTSDGTIAIVSFGDGATIRAEATVENLSNHTAQQPPSRTGTYDWWIQQNSAFAKSHAVTPERAATISQELKAMYRVGLEPPSVRLSGPITLGDIQLRDPGSWVFQSPNFIDWLDEKVRPWVELLFTADAVSLKADCHWNTHTEEFTFFRDGEVLVFPDGRTTFHGHQLYFLLGISPAEVGHRDLTARAHAGDIGAQRVLFEKIVRCGFYLDYRERPKSSRSVQRRSASSYHRQGLADGSGKEVL